MYICYLDESGDPGVRGSEYLLLGAAALFEGRWRYMREDIDRLIQKHFTTSTVRPAEIHMVELRQGKGNFRGLSRIQREAIETDLCNIALDNLPAEMKFFTAVSYTHLTLPTKRIV